MKVFFMFNFNLSELSDKELEELRESLEDNSLLSAVEREQSRREDVERHSC